MIFSYYNNYMANVLATDKQIAVISSLCEGSSIRSIERITGVHRDTIMRLGVKVGKGCTTLMDAKMRNLECARLEKDEIWGYIGKVYAWIHETDDPAHPKRHVTVLHIPPVVSPRTAVQAVIVQDFDQHGKAN